MSHKDYELLATAIRETKAYIGTNTPELYAIGGHGALENLAGRLAIMLAEDNSRFDVARFRRACAC